MKKDLSVKNNVENEETGIGNIMFKPLLDNNADNYSLYDLKNIIENEKIPLDIRISFSKEYLERTKSGQKNRHVEKMAKIVGTVVVATTFCICYCVSHSK